MEIIMNLIDDIVFSGGEINFNIKNIRNEDVNIFAKLKNSKDIMKLKLICNALETHGVNKDNIKLNIPYIPYARQDRLTEIGGHIGYSVFKEMFGMYKIKTLSLHCIDDSIENVVFEPYKEIRNNILIYADSSAHRHVKFNTLNNEYTFLKNRKTNTVYCEKKIEDTGYSFYIVDDICDGGWTHIEVARKLPKEAPKTLIVTHGIFRHGLKELLKHYNQIITTDSFHDEIKNERVQLFNSFKILRSNNV